MTSVLITDVTSRHFELKPILFVRPEIGCHVYIMPPGTGCESPIRIQGRNLQ